MLTTINNQSLYMLKMNTGICENMYILVHYNETYRKFHYNKYYYNDVYYD